MTKSELKDGMVVETRNGNKYMVLGDLLMRHQGFISKSEYNDDLRTGDEFDIMKVYDKIRTLNLEDADVLLWDREEEESKFKVGDIYMDESDGEKFIILSIADYVTSYPYRVISINKNVIDTDVYNKFTLSEYKFIENNIAMARDFNTLLENLKKA